MKSCNGRVVVQLDQRYRNAIVSNKLQPRGGVLSGLTVASKLDQRYRKAIVSNELQPGGDVLSGLAVASEIDQRYRKAIVSNEFQPKGDILSVLTMASKFYIPFNPGTLEAPCEQFHVQDHGEVNNELGNDDISVLMDGLDSDLGGNGPCFIVEHRIFDQLYYLTSEHFLTQSPLVKTKVLDMLGSNLLRFVVYASNRDSNGPMQ